MNQDPKSNPESTAAAPRRGGLYNRVKISVKALDAIIVVLIAVLVLAVLFMVSHNGFTVTYDTQGGTPVESVRVMHGEYVSPRCRPARAIASAVGIGIGTASTPLTPQPSRSPTA